MYAVFSTGGKQYRASAGDRIKVEKLDADEGATVELGQVLMVGEGEDVNVGSPFVDGGKVTATVVEHGRGEKIKVLKFKRRKQHMKRMGHRQSYTLLEITGIEGAKARSDKGAKPKDDAKAGPDKGAKPKGDAKADGQAGKKAEKKTEAKAEAKTSKPKAEPKASKPKADAKAESKDSKKADAKAEPKAEKAKDDGKADD